MNKLFLLRSFIATLAIAIIILIAGTEVFQGNEKTDFQKHTEKFYDYDETDPYIDRPTNEARMHLTENDDVLDVITDANGFDNFEIGVDFAEQMLVSNPRNPLNMQFGVNSGGGQNAYYTTNGHDWTSSNPAYHASTCCDPWSAFDSLGNLFYGSGVSNQYVYKSTNGGQTYGAAVLSVSGNDRNTLAADQTNGPYKNYLYAAITPGNFARSTNNGTSWTTTYSPSNTIPGVMIAVGPNGATQGGCVMYVTNTGTSSNVTYTFHRSTNGGANFTVMSSLTVAGFVGTLNSAGRLVINNGRTRPYPMIAMDNSYGPYRGRLYLVYASNVPAGNGNKPDIIMQYSTNQGSTWSSKITVNDNANPQLSDQWFPAIWCEKETGRLYIKWYDTRENPATYAVNVYATYTDDGGSTFAPNQKLTTTSWTYPNPSCAPNTNCYRGDYDGMTANPKTSFSVWYDGRLGTYKNVGAYFPDYAMTVSPTSANIHNTNDFKLIDVNVPAVKLYTDAVNFTTAVTPVPGAGSIVADFPSGNSLSSPYPKTAKMRVRTIGTVTNGVYTVTVTGSGPNGTPVHKRTVSITVGNTLAAAPCEDFTELFPPTDLGFDFTGDNYWSRNSQSAYGSGTGSARFNSWSAPVGTNQALVSMSFTAVGANTYLTFDNAYRPWSGGNIDSLLVESSSNFGASYTTLEKLWGGLGAQAGPLNTVFTGGSQFAPLNHQWRSKIYLLPVGTNKIRLRAVSGFGNDIFVDNVCVQILPAPSAIAGIGLVPEGFYRALPSPQAIPDTIRVYLHRTDFPNIAVDSAVSYYNTNAVANGPFNKAISGTYYIVLKHRNSLETWSKSGGQLYSRGSTLNFNFINPVNQAYNNNQALIDPAPFYGMYGGDVNRDFSIDITDVSQIENAAAIFLTGYVIEDLTGDDFVDINDQAIADNNASNFVVRQTPPGADLGPSVTEEVVTLPETNFENEALRQKHDLTIKLLNDQKAQEKISIEMKRKKDKETELRKKKINSVKEKMRSSLNKNEKVNPEVIKPDRPGSTFGQ
ncbi:MAG TPA: sialidase family protein [Ignavibacteria bacterium]|nr:sialidase family protein [Ignavibacteria bacterium]HRK00359.1 sialidase family protein [Ignavibacteria bacterium]